MTTSIDLTKFENTKDALIAARAIEKSASNEIGIIGRHAAKLAIAEMAKDEKANKLDTKGKYNVIKTLYAPEINDSPTLERAFLNALLCLLAPSTAISVETKNDEGQKVELQSSAAEIVDNGTKRELEAAAKAVREEIGMGRKRTPRPAGTTGATAPVTTSGDNIKTRPVSLTVDQLYNSILNDVNTRLESQDDAFVEKLKAVLEKHGLTIAKKRPARERKAKAA